MKAKMGGMDSPVEYAQKIDTLLNEADKNTATAALAIAKELVQHRLVRVASASVAIAWTELKQRQGHQEAPPN